MRAGFCVYHRLCLYDFIFIPFPFSFQKTSGGGRDSTGLPFSSRPKLNHKCPQPHITLLSTPSFPPCPECRPSSSLISFKFPPPPSFALRNAPPQNKPRTKARPQDRCALVLHKRSTRSPPSSTHALTPHIMKVANCKMQSDCTALVT